MVTDVGKKNDYLEARYAGGPERMLVTINFTSKAGQIDMKHCLRRKSCGKMLHRTQQLPDLSIFDDEIRQIE